MLDKQAYQQRKTNRNVETIYSQQKLKKKSIIFELDIDVPDFDQGLYLKGIGENHQR